MKADGRQVSVQEGRLIVTKNPKTIKNASDASSLQSDRRSATNVTIRPRATINSLFTFRIQLGRFGVAEMEASAKP